MCSILERRVSESNPMRYSQCYFRNNMALPLICHKSYLCTKAKIIDKADRLGASPTVTLNNYIPAGGGS